MKIAVTYDNGEVFQHFGKTAYFKLYDIEDHQIIRSDVISTNGQGHGALAYVLNEIGADVLICGGIGMGARNALASIGIELVAGAAGNCDEVLNAYLSGLLITNGGMCDHHGHENGKGCSHHHCGNHEVF